MKVTTKGHYGLMAMAELALHHGQGPVSLKTIAENQGLSEHYLEQLFASLRRAGLVRSVRGAQGGYLLGREPEEISVGDALRVLEGPLVPMDCALEGPLEEIDHCTNPHSCLVREVWVKLAKAIEEVADGITLADLREKAREMQRRKGVMFYI